MSDQVELHRKTCRHSNHTIKLPIMRFALIALASLTALAVGQSNAYIPSWNGPELHAWLPGGGLPAVKGPKWARIYHAEPEFGTYNHACMIDAFNGSFLAYWKNSPIDEDQPGQRVLWSFSADGQQWTPTDGKNILFPNMSTSGNLVALFAEPALHINGHQCVLCCIQPGPCMRSRAKQVCCSVPEAILSLSHPIPRGMRWFAALKCLNAT